MTMAEAEAVLVHIAGSDLPESKPCSCGKGTKAIINSVDLSNLASGNARMLLGMANSRVRATIIAVSANTTDRFLLAASESDAQAGTGAILDIASCPIMLSATNELWVAHTTDSTHKSDNPIVSVVAEYRD